MPMPPLTVAFARRKRAALYHLRSDLRWWHRLALCLLLPLCVASDCGLGKAYTRGPFLVNHAGEAVALTLRWWTVESACDARPSELRKAVTASPSAPQHVVHLAPSQVATLAHEPSDGDPIVSRCPGYDDIRDGGAVSGAIPCVVVEVSGDMVVHALIHAPRYWYDDHSGSRCRNQLPLYEDPGDGAVRLVRRDDGRIELRAEGQSSVMAL